MKKRFIMVAMVMLMIMCLTACGAQEEDNGPNATTEVGDIVTFGTYEQDNDLDNGSEDVEWIVLDKAENEVLLISKYGLDCQKYQGTSWENCALREWLNNDFRRTAFDEEEDARILRTEVKNEDNKERGTEAGPDTIDKLFVLSVYEAEEYFDSQSERICSATEYAKDRGVWYSDCSWWLRTPGAYEYYAMQIYSAGHYKYFGEDASKLGTAVRPAMWVSVE